ncbi:hypothetical protein V5F32_08385 [Xanthobacter oligotrophicus]|uniref:Uncharacterized protein n=1 Tax=Xanthobacter oligotrophicus TaxID=2607286 RepID=A0ABW6ZTW5_9HYPH
MLAAFPATAPTAIGPRGVPLADIDNTPIRIDGHLPSAFLTPRPEGPTVRGEAPMVPRHYIFPCASKLAAGWFSIWEFLAITEPGTLAFSNVAEDWQEEEDAAAELARREGVEPIRVPAPAVLASGYGIPTVLLFPDAILRDAFPSRR